MAIVMRTPGMPWDFRYQDHTVYEIANAIGIAKNAEWVASKNPSVEWAVWKSTGKRVGICRLTIDKDHVVYARTIKAAKAIAEEESE